MREVAVLGNPGADRGMSDLEQDRASASSDEDAFAADRAHLGRLAGPSHWRRHRHGSY
jgi:hypothetical protein